MTSSEKPGEEEGSSEGNEAGGVSGHVRSVGSWEPTRAECGVPIGPPSAGIQRGNHLFLLTDPSGTVYWGNRGLKNNMWSNAGGNPNTKDTVENVFVQKPASGTWIVTVIASELNQDTHVETAVLDSDYALVVSGIKLGP